MIPIDIGLAAPGMRGQSKHGILCGWCFLDYFVEGRCVRCNQREATCNEIAGRTFPRSWVDWRREEATATPPRMPSHRCTVAIVSMRWAEFLSAIDIPAFIDRIAAATGIPASILLGTRTQADMVTEHYAEWRRHNEP
jgi:hypothetical protein